MLQTADGLTEIPPLEFSPTHVIRNHQRYRQTDRQTDGRTDRRHMMAIPSQRSHAIAWDGKNCTDVFRGLIEILTTMFFRKAR